jgi:UDP-N-acetylmuramate dehydrogenase
MEALQRQLNTLGVPYHTDVCLAPYTTFHIGGPAALMVEPQNEEQLVSTLRALRKSGVFSLVLGRGSNLLLPDEGIYGVIIRTCEIDAVCIDGRTLVANGGATLTAITRAAQKAGLSGLEFAYGNPGTLGGALFMNAGAYGGQMSDVVTSVRLYDAERDEIFTFSGEQMAFAYRHSILQAHPEWTVLSAAMLLTPDDAEQIDARMQDYMTRRREKQPLNYPSAGSAFKRPVGAFAGALIEQCGLKGYAVGGAMVSPKHAGFIVNTGDATARDVLTLMEHVRTKVFETHGIELESEIQIVVSHLAK